MTREEREFDKFTKKHGQPIGRLAERNPDTGMYDAVTADGYSAQTMQRLPCGLSVLLWSNEPTVTP